MSCKPAPDVADLTYGPYSRNVLDFWRGKGPVAPLVIFFHGGGFRGGDKNDLTETFLEACQTEGFAVATVNYRLSAEAAYPAQMVDGARALQFARHHAGELGIDPGRVALSGSSAGAGISLWLGFHEDLARPKSTDPIAGQSTRPAVLGVFNAQCSYDPRFLKKLGLGQAKSHPFFQPFYGVSQKDIERCTPEACALFEDASSITHLRVGAPPVYMVYRQADDPLPSDPEFLLPAEGNDAPQIANIALHHPKLGYALKERLDKLGIENEVHAGASQDFAGSERGMVRFFSRHLKI